MLLTVTEAKNLKMHQENFLIYKFKRGSGFDDVFIQKLKRLIEVIR